MVCGIKIIHDISEELIVGLRNVEGNFFKKKTLDLFLISSSLAMEALSCGLVVSMLCFISL